MESKKNVELTHDEIIANLIIIDKDWLIGKIKDVNNGLISSTEVLQCIFTNSCSFSANNANAATFKQ